MKKAMTVCCVVAVLLICGAALGDTIRMKNGSVIKGKVVSFSQGEFTVVIETGSGRSRAILNVSDIDEIQFDDAQSGDGRSVSISPRIDSASGPSGQGSQPEIKQQRAPQTDKADEREMAEVKTEARVPNVRSVVISVPAREDWVSTGLRIRRGQRIRISASGQITLSKGERTGPDGVNSDDRDKLMPDRPTGALVAVVGDDNDDFIFIGKEAEFVAKRDGILFLNINASDLKDNSGAFTAQIQVELSGAQPR